MCNSLSKKFIIFNINPFLNHIIHLVNLISVKKLLIKPISINNKIIVKGIYGVYSFNQ